MAWARSRLPVLIWLTCDLTVEVLTNSAPAISVLDRPWAIRASQDRVPAQSLVVQVAPPTVTVIRAPAGGPLR
jgi:hypothetical protein